MRPKQDADVGVCGVVSKSLRFPSSTLKRSLGDFNLKLGQAAFPKPKSDSKTLDYYGCQA